jgi:outer membrane protein OmpA-like peptidoglycan-associated protein
VQVPSIVFGANSGGFDGLEPDVIEANDYILNRIAAVLNKFDTYKVTVEGHTNPVEQNEARKRAEQAADLKLSAQRAQTVVDYLTQLGVDGSRLSAIGVGSSRTLVPYAGPDGQPNRDNWWKNRRVEFLLVK